MSKLLTPADRRAWHKLYRAGFRCQQDTDSGLWIVLRPDAHLAGTWCASRDLAVSQFLTRLRGLQRVQRSLLAG